MHGLSSSLGRQEPSLCSLSALLGSPASPRKEFKQLSGALTFETNTQD